MARDFKQVDAGASVLITDECISCGKPSSVTMPKEAFAQWQIYGAKIQQAWPNSTPAQRETAQSGMHEECFDTMTEEDE